MTSTGRAGASTGGARRASLRALYTTGHWLLRQGRHADAAAVVRAMVRLAPCEELGWLALGACHEAADQIEIALEIYGVGRVVAAPAPRCELARARALRALGMHDEAFSAYALAAQAAQRAGDDDVANLVEQERNNR